MKSCFVMEISVLENILYVESYAAPHSQHIEHTHPSPLSFRQISSHMRSGLIRPPGASSLVLFGARSIGAAYPDIVQINLRICAWDWCSAGRIWEGEADARRLWSVKKFSL